MNTIKDKVLIKAKRGSKLEHKVQGTDITIHLLPHFREFEEDIITQDGVIFGAPMKLSSGKEVDIKEGDKVYGHHFMTHEEHEAFVFGEGVYELDYQSIYCKVVDGKIVMVGEWNFLEAIEDEPQKTATGLIAATGTKPRRDSGIMKYPSKHMKEMGVREGNVVHFGTDRSRIKADPRYIIIVEGKKYYRVHDNHIVAYYGEE